MNSYDILKNYLVNLTYLNIKTKK